MPAPVAPIVGVGVAAASAFPLLRAVVPVMVGLPFHCLNQVHQAHRAVEAIEGISLGACQQNT